MPESAERRLGRVMNDNDMPDSGGQRGPRKDPLSEESPGPKGKKGQGQDSAPTLEQIESRAARLKSFWDARNQRMVRHQRLYDLRKKQAADGKILAYMNDPKVIVDKIAGLVARRRHRIQVPPKGERNAEAAQRIENACRWWENHANLQWARAIHNPIAYDRAQSLFLRGWVVERLMVDPDAPGFVADSVFDPYNFYPKMAGSKLLYACYIYRATPEEIEADFPECDLGDLPEDSPVEVTSYYDARGPQYWHAVVVGGRWAKKPVELEYFPWVVGVAKGRWAGEIDDEGDHSEFIGQGFLDAIEDVYLLINKFVTMLANTVSKGENPPRVTFTQNGKPKTISLEPGAQNYMLMNENVKLLDVGLNVGQLMPMMTTLQDRLNKGSLPSAMFGEGTSLDSGYMSALMMGAAQDTLWAFIKAMETFHGLRYERFLTLFRDFSDRDLAVVYLDRQEESATAGKRIWDDKGLTVKDVEDNGVYVEAIYEDISPQDRVALGNLAAMLVREKLLDLKTAREKYIDIDDPDLVNDRILAELVYMNEGAVAELTKLNLRLLGRHKELKALAAAEKEEAAAEGLPPGQLPTGTPGAVPPQVPPGLPPELAGQVPPQLQVGPPPGQVPGVGITGGLPPEALPPEMAGMQEAVPTDEELVAQILGGMPL